MNVIIFDLFGTLIEEKKYDYGHALHWLADTYFAGRYDELKALSLKFKDDYMRMRKISERENSFFKQLALFERELHIKLCDDYSSVEFNFIRRFREEKMVKGVRELLEYLHLKNRDIYILTNSIFSGDNLKKYLDITFGTEKYLKKVYSSADIGFRKPSKEIFQYVLTELGITHPEEVFYIGDSPEKDYFGAKAAGLTPILVGPIVDASGLAFSDMGDLYKYFQGIYGF